MPVQPTGRFSQSLHTVRDWVLAAASWQSWAGANYALQGYLISAPVGAPRPYFIVDFNTTGRRRDGQTVGPFTQTGGVLLYFCDDARQGSDGDAETDFLNRVDAVLTELESLAPKGGAPLVLNGYDLAGGPARIADQSRDRLGDELEIMWALDLTVWP